MQKRLKKLKGEEEQAKSKGTKNERNEGVSIAYIKTCIQTLYDAKMISADEAIVTYGFQKYIGVGGHLFAIAAEISERLGYEGFLYGEAMDEELMLYYIEKFGAIRIPREHPYSISFSGKATKRIREVYEYVWTDEEP